MTDNEIIQEYREAHRKVTAIELKVEHLRINLIAAQDDMDRFWTAWRVKHVCDCHLIESRSVCEHDEN